MGYTEKHRMTDRFSWVLLA